MIHKLPGTERCARCGKAGHLRYDDNIDQVHCAPPGCNARHSLRTHVEVSQRKEHDRTATVPRGVDPNPAAPWPGTEPVAPPSASPDRPERDPGPAAPRDRVDGQRLRQADALTLRALGISLEGTGLAASDTSRVLDAEQVERLRRAQGRPAPTPEQRKRRAKQDAALRRAGIGPAGVSFPGSGSGFNGA